jgi:phage gpG-like protein
MTQIEASEFSVFLDAMAGEFERINMAPALQRCVPVIIEGVQSHFQQAVSPFGTPWPPRVDGSTDSLLVKSGAMRAAATGGPGNVTRIEGNILTYGVSKAVIPYAAVHNFGHPPRS